MAGGKSTNRFETDLSTSDTSSSYSEVQRKRRFRIIPAGYVGPNDQSRSTI